MKNYVTCLLILICANSYANNPDHKSIQNFNQVTKWAFEENKGQVTGEDSARVKFFYKQGNLTMFLMNNGIAYQFEKRYYPEEYKTIGKFASNEYIEKQNKLQDSIRVETYRMDIDLVGASQNSEIIKEGKSSDYIQYYNHNALDVHAYEKIIYKNIYPNIDWVIYKTDSGIKYDFVVHQGGNYQNIQLKTKWVEDVKINQDGSLIIKNLLGEIREEKPISFQDSLKIHTKFQLNKDIIYFETENYDKSSILIIDPIVRKWGTYYGDVSDDFGTTSTIDKNGFIYLGGATWSSNNIASGGYQNTFGGALSDAFLVKFDSSGARIWATYYGGNSNEFGLSSSSDNSNNIYLAGRTYSSNNIASNGHQNNYVGFEDAFLVKFNSNGVRIWGTYYGGYSSDRSFCCATDIFNNVYLTGSTQSDTGIAYNGFQNTYVNNTDAFLVKFDSSGIRKWGTYLGLDYNSTDESYGCATDFLGNVYMCGYTGSYNGIAIGGHQNTYGGAYLVKFNTNGTRLWGTYYGFSCTGYSCTVDKNNNVYMCGRIGSDSLIAFNGHQNIYGGGLSDAFIVKFNSNGVRKWGTCYGGSGTDEGKSISIDSNSHIYLAGFTTSFNNIAYKGFQNIHGGGFYDAFVAKFDTLGKREWGTYYGGGDRDEGVFFNSFNSNASYLSGRTLSNSSISSGGFKNVIGGINDAFLVRFGNCTSYTTSTIIVDTCDKYKAPSGLTIYQSGVFLDTINNYIGCDSIITINLTIRKKDTTVFFDTICSNQTVIFNGNALSISGSYYDTFINNVGCDSLIIYNLFVKAISNYNFTITKCNNTPYNFNGNFIDSSGVYKDTLKNIFSCDSIITLTLRIGDSSPTIIYDTICQNRSYHFNNTSIKNAGLYYDTLTSSFGCDSFINLILYVKDTSESTLYDTTCSNIGIVFNNVIRNSSGIYKDTLTNSYGCDSILTLILFVKQSSVKDLYDSICEGDSIFFNSSWRKNAAIYRDTLVNSIGCDSFVNLFLYVKRKTFSTINYRTCFNTPYFFNGQNLNLSGAYYDTLINFGGCDSIIQLNLTVIPNLIRPDFDTSLSICYGSSNPHLNSTAPNGIIGVWNPSEINNTKSSSYEFTPTPNQCATNTKLFVTIKPLPIIKFDYNINDTICVGDSVRISIQGESNYSYKWSNNSTQSTFIDFPKENKEYIVTVSNSLGCTMIDSAKIVTRYTDVKITGKENVLRGDVVLLTAISNSPISEYFWSPIDYFKHQQNKQVSIKVYDPLVVELNVRDSFGCLAYDKFPIKILGKDILIPEAFSPNKDGINDIFVPIYKGHVKVLTFKIYNRWGELVHYNNEKNKLGWDGEYNGEKCPTGIYVYIVEYSVDSILQKLEGNVTLIR